MDVFLIIVFLWQITNMAEKVPSFKNGGAYWFLDLTTPDVLYIFPVLTGLTFLITVEVSIWFIHLHFSTFIRICSRSAWMSLILELWIKMLLIPMFTNVVCSSVQHARRFGRKSYCWHHEKCFKGHGRSYSSIYNEFSKG